MKLLKYLPNILSRFDQKDKTNKNTHTHREHAHSTHQNLYEKQTHKQVFWLYDCLIISVSIIRISLQSSNE